ncbi:MAG: hypothetical protein HYX90_03240 [Chloroflexi bacterium]|nr:hypothetical protein [Chloroflexota bacterium]
MGDESSSQMEGDNTCAACGRIAILIKLRSRALSLKGLHDKERDVYLRFARLGPRHQAAQFTDALER